METNEDLLYVQSEVLWIKPWDYFIQRKQFPLKVSLESPFHSLASIQKLSFSHLVVKLELWTYSVPIPLFLWFWICVYGCQRCRCRRRLWRRNHWPRRRRRRLLKYSCWSSHENWPHSIYLIRPAGFKRDSWGLILKLLPIDLISWDVSCQLLALVLGKTLPENAIAVIS